MNNEPNVKKEDPIKIEKKITKVIKGTAQAKKKNEIRKFADVFISEDIGSIKTFIITDVIVPAIKKTVSDTVSGIFDIIKNSVEVALYGETISHKKGMSGSRTSYGKFYDDRRDDRRSVPDYRSASRYDYDIYFETRGDAEAVLNQMDEVIEVYGFVSISEMYDMAELTPPPFTWVNYGWKDIRSARVERVRDKYIIKLPKALPID